MEVPASPGTPSCLPCGQRLALQLGRCGLSPAGSTQGPFWALTPSLLRPPQATRLELLPGACPVLSRSVCLRRDRVWHTEPRPGDMISRE